MTTVEEIDRRFGFHPATPSTGPKHRAVRESVRRVALELAMMTPAGREQALALTALQEAMMWANAAIACDPGNIAEHAGNDAVVYYIDKSGRSEQMDPPPSDLIDTSGLSQIVSLGDWRDQRAFA